MGGTAKQAGAAARCMHEQPVEGGRQNGSSLHKEQPADLWGMHKAFIGVAREEGSCSVAHCPCA
eukprot:7687547-Prorocentrum_lima.AAC.1